MLVSVEIGYVVLVRNWYTKVNKSTGCDNISPRLLEDSAEFIAAPLTRIINISLTMGVVPNKLKCAKVIPVFKKGEKSDMDNYRPVSVLPTVSKILEKAVHYWLSVKLK